MKESFKETVASELRILRAKYGYTQKEIAEKADVDTMTIVRYENNNSSMQLDMLEKITNAYDIPIYIFFENISANLHNKN